MIKASYKTYFVLILCGLMAIQKLAAAHYAENFSEAKKVARLIWSEHRETFYCGCPYDRYGTIDYEQCSFRPSDKRASKRISWEHIMPVSWYGVSRSCWKSSKNQKPREACREKDPDFRKMEADLHNLVPAIREINTVRRNYGYGQLKGDSYQGCHFIINKPLKLVEPRDEVKGMTARIMLYMAEKYQIKLKPGQKQILMTWDHAFPPDAWEKRWHEKVSTLQGDRNPYIDNYHLLSRG
jgi:deoxyribonuclease-1